MNSSAVDVRRGAEENANVSRQHFSAQPFATVVDCVLRTNIALKNLLVLMYFFNARYVDVDSTTIHVFLIFKNVGLAI